MAGLGGAVAFVAQRSQRFTRYFHIIKGNDLPFGYLRFLMAFPGEQYDVAGRGVLNDERDGLAAIGLHCIFHTRFLQSNDGIVDDGERIFGARVIGGEHDEIASLAGGLAHQGTLSAIAIATAAEQGNDFSFQAGLRNKVAGQRGEVAERVVGVRVVDDNREGLAAIDALEPAGNAGKVEYSLRDRFGGTIAGIPGSRSGENVIDIDVANERRPDRELTGRRHHLKAASTRGDLKRVGMKVARGETVG